VAGTAKNHTVVHAVAGEDVKITVDGTDSAGKPAHNDCAHEGGRVVDSEMKPPEPPSVLSLTSTRRRSQTGTAAAAPGTSREDRTCP
jgi:hypothetical protein